MVSIDENDEGKTVVNAAGETIGTVVDVDNHTAHVEPDPGVTDELAAAVGLGSSDEGTFELDNDTVDAVTDDEIRLEDRH